MISMKKMTCTMILALIMILSLSACGGNEEKATARVKTKSLYAQGLEVIQLMLEMAQTEEYIDMLAGSTEIKSVVQDINTGDYSKPKAVYAISVTDDELAFLAEFDSLDDISDDLKTLLMQKLHGSLMMRINGMSGALNLAAASVCTAGKTFVNKDVTEDVIYLYTYDDAVPVAVVFTVGEDHAVSASGMFVMFDGFTCGSADEIEAFFGYVDIDVVEVLAEK